MHIMPLENFVPEHFHITEIGRIQRNNLLIAAELDSAVQYIVADVEVTPKGLLFVLTDKQTDCPAPDKCGVSKCSCC